MFTLKRKQKKLQSARLSHAIGMCRQSLGCSRSELAMRTGMSEQRLADIESCKAEPNIFDLMALSVVFELTLSELLEIAHLDEIPSGDPDADKSERALAH